MSLRARAGAARPNRSVSASFGRTVLALVRRVPAGRVVTYGQVAALLGSPRAARAVGHVMRRCPPGVPWHRVVNAEGRISRRGNGGGMLSQRLLLEGEGVRFVRGRLDLGRHAWRTGAERYRPEAGLGERR